MNQELSRTTGSPARAAADRLAEARTTMTPCPPIRDLIASDDLLGAYEVQALGTAQRLSEGRIVVGRKIGLTSTAVQTQLGVDQPDFGVLLDDMEYADGDTIPIGRLLQPRIEAEVAFRLAHDLDEGELDLEQVRLAVDHAVCALEVADSRVSGWDISFVDTVGDNASAGVYVLGDRALALDEFEPREVVMSMSVTGQPDSQGTGADCLGDPLLALQWLARKARELGEPLRAGQIVLSGALGPMRAVALGATATAEFSTLGSVSVHFSSEEA
jgi:2-keto-4-pentenoate hydratase